MNLSDRTSDLKVFSRNKYSDGLPHTSDDIHQEQDLMLKKTGMILDTLIGSSLLEPATFQLSINGDTTSVRLASPVPVNLGGDIFLIGNNENVYPLEVSSSFTGSIVLVCWYTNVTSNSDIYAYGGLCNEVVENDLLNSALGIQTSSRYQVRWNLALCDQQFDYSNPATSVIDGVHPFLSENGETTRQSWTQGVDIFGKFYRVPQSTSIPSTDGYVYILPIASVSSGTISPYKVQLPLTGIESTTTPSSNLHKVWYNPVTDEVKMFFNGEWRDVGSSPIVNQVQEPTGRIKEGTIWYNPGLGEFKVYIEEIGFVDTYAKMGFVQLQATHIVTETISTPQNITIPIPVDTYLSSDLLTVSYEGLELVKGTHYTLDTTTKSITLTDFTVDEGDVILFVATRLVGSSDLVTTLTLLENHINDTGNLNKSGHLKLTDTVSNLLTQNSGVAATPAALHAVAETVNSYKDESTGTAYEMGIENGILFIREKV